MGNYKGQDSLDISWIIFCLAAVQVVVSQPVLTSSIEQKICPGNTIYFACTTTGSSILIWRSEEYIGSSNQYEFRFGIDNNGTIRNSTFNPETIATLTAVNTNGPILTSILRIIARPTPPNISVSCINAGGGISTLTIPLAVVPGVPQMIDAAEISQPRDNICIILVQWDPPANSNAADIAQYTVYVPSRNIRNDILSSTLTTLTVPNCGDDVRIQVAAVNRVGCVGMNSSEVLPVLLDIPTGIGSATTEGGSAQTSSTSSVIAAASVSAIFFIISCFLLVVVLVLFTILYKRGKKIQAAGQAPPPEVSKLEEHIKTETKLIDDLQGRIQDASVKRNLEELYNALKLKLPSTKMQVAARDLKATLMSGRESSEFNDNVKETFISCLEELQLENDEVVQRFIENIDNILTGMTGMDEEFKRDVRLLRTKVGTGEHKEVLDKLIKRMEKAKCSIIMNILLLLCEKLRNVRQVKDYYCKQSKHDFDKLGTEKDRVSVPIWIDDALDDNWKDSLRKAVQAVNEAAPGLSLSITEDENGAIIHVLAIDEKDLEPYTEVEGNILNMRLKEKKFVTKIRLGKWKDDGKKRVCIHELLHALGFHHEHQDAIAEPYEYHLDSGKKITIDKNELRFIWWESSTTTLYPCEKKCREHSEAGHVCKWVLKAYPTKVNTDLDEHDMVGLNLVYPPCVDKTAKDVRYKPDLGKNGMYYCGREVVFGRTYPGEEYDHFCGPDKGPNCSACRTIKSPRVKQILAGGRWQGMTGRVYCGRLFTEPAKLSKTHDGVCGMDNGQACPDCINILNKEHDIVQSASHPLALVQ